jgi:outer membrane protein OmpA-like peptidoglycan-associated protein
MNESRPAQRHASRTVVIAAVALLIVIAVAGIVLAGRYSTPAPAGAAPAPTAPVASTQPEATGPTSAPNEVLFAAGSDRLTAQSSESVARFSESARTAGGMVRVTARYATGENKAKDVTLAKARAAVVRHALQANGLKPESMQVELIEMPAGGMNDKDANRVDLSLP